MISDLLNAMCNNVLCEYDIDCIAHVAGKGLLLSLNAVCITDQMQFVWICLK